MPLFRHLTSHLIRAIRVIRVIRVIIRLCCPNVEKNKKELETIQFKLLDDSFGRPWLSHYPYQLDSPDVEENFNRPKPKKDKDSKREAMLGST